ncbi:MAG: elongation factor Ts [Ruminococcaceae bacterium]|nr:elongation factor Ts [Oscillospiraceae bacterium]
MNITASMVADLRKKTGCGMMECKKALVEAEGNIDEAIKVLRERGLAVAAKKADRIAADGVVDIKTNGNTTAMIEVNSETDFVAKNENFRAFVVTLLDTIIANKPANVEALLASKYLDTAVTVADKMQEMVFTIGEKLDIRRFVVVDGTVSTYIHGKGSTGVIVTFDADETAKSNEGFAEFAKNIALQVAAYPTAYLDRESVPASVVEEEKNVLIAQIKNDPANSKKPENIIEKMVIGRIGKFYENNCLCEQGYVKDDSMKVAQYVEKTAKEFGGAIKITGFFRFEKGEGIAKREENFADEISKMVNK